MKRGYIIALGNIARLNARIAGMVAENDYRKACGNQVAYAEEAFMLAIDEECCGFNSIVALVNEE